MKFLILGSNSFLGSSFLAHALEQGHECIGCSRSDPPHVAFLPHRWTGYDVPFWRIDLNEDLDLGAAILADVLFREEPTHIINFAAQSMVAESWRSPTDWMQTNVLTLARLLELLRVYKRLERYVHVTTPEVYGSTNGWVTEDHPFNPSTPYATSRAAGDMLLRNYHEQYGFPVVFTKPSNIYGPGQRLYRIVAKTILSVVRGQTLPLDGGGVSKRSFLHSSDCSDGILRAALDGCPGQSYHLSGYELITIRRLVEMVLERLGRSIDDGCVTDGPERAGKDLAYRLDSRKARIELGWRDKISLSTGISDVIQWTRRFEDVLKDAPLDYEHKP